MSRFGLGPEIRLTDRREFSSVFASGRKTVGRNLILWQRESGAARHSRLGLSIGSKVGIAVRRNRLKRLAREAFRLNRGRLKPSRDLVVYFRRGCRWRGLPDAERDFIELCAKAELLSG